MDRKAKTIGGALVVGGAAFLGVFDDAARWGRYVDDIFEFVTRLVPTSDDISSGGAKVSGLVSEGGRLRILKQAVAGVAPEASVSLDDGGRVVVISAPDGAELKAAAAVLDPGADAPHALGAVDDLAFTRSFCNVTQCFAPLSDQRRRLSITCGPASMTLAATGPTFAVDVLVGSIEASVGADGAGLSVSIPVRDCAAIEFTTPPDKDRASPELNPQGCTSCGIALSALKLLARRSAGAGRGGGAGDENIETILRETRSGSLAETRKRIAETSPDALIRPVTSGRIVVDQLSEGREIDAMPAILDEIDRGDLAREAEATTCRLSLCPAQRLSAGSVKGASIGILGSLSGTCQAGEHHPPPGPGFAFLATQSRIEIGVGVPHFAVAGCADPTELLISLADLFGMSARGDIPF